MLYKGTEDKEFIKCGSKDYNLPIQKELAKVGNYQDCFVIKDNKRYERHYIKKAVFDGTENGWSVYTQGNMSNYYNNSLLNFKTQEGISNYFEVSNDNSYNNTDTRLVIFNSKIGFGIYTEKSKFESLEAFKNKLSEWNEAGNPLCLYYVLATPENIECTNEQSEILEQLNNSELYKPTTIITTDNALAEISLEYNGYEGTPSPKYINQINTVNNNIDIFKINKDIKNSILNIMNITNSTNNIGMYPTSNAYSTRANFSTTDYIDIHYLKQIYINYRNSY